MFPIGFQQTLAKYDISMVGAIELTKQNTNRDTSRDPFRNFVLRPPSRNCSWN